MKRTMSVLLSVALLASVIGVTLFAQGLSAQIQDTTTATTKSPQKKTGAKKAEPTIAEQLSEMKRAIEAQQQEIRQLSGLVQSRDQKIQQLEQRLDQSQAAATQAQTKEIPQWHKPLSSSRPWWRSRATSPT